MRDLAGKVAVVTGGASGIGLGMAQSFAQAGMHVVLADVQADRAEERCARLRAEGVRALAVATDVAERASLERLAERTFREFGAVHVLCNNAGVCLGGPLAEASDEDWRWLLSVNLEGVVNGIQAFVPRLLAQGQGGHIVNTSSMGGLLAGPWLGIYCTTKFAVLGLSESLRAELEPRGIGVSVLCPGFVRTDLLDAARNRPAHLGDRAGRLEPLKQGVETGMDPRRVGERVVAGIRANEPYIFTHGGFLDPLKARFQAILQALERAGEDRVRES